MGVPLRSQVNYLGVVRVAKAFIPLLKRSALQARGRLSRTAAPRLMIVSSMAGKVTFPMMSAYCASKHACTAFASCLRMELRMWGIDVCTVQPTFLKTPLVETSALSFMRTWEVSSPTLRAEYGDCYFHSALHSTRKFMYRFCWDLASGTAVICRAVTRTRSPPQELSVGIDGLTAVSLMHYLPSWVYEFLIYTNVLSFIVEPE